MEKLEETEDEEESAECSTDTPHCSQSPPEDDQTSEEIPLSTRIPPSVHRRQRRPSFRSTEHGMPPEINGFPMKSSMSILSPNRLLFIAILCTVFQRASAITESRCGPVDIRNTPWGYRQIQSTLGDSNMVDHVNKSITECTIIEGSFTMSFIYRPRDRVGGYTNLDYPQFPYLVEITGSLLIFETTGLTDLNWIFPSLRVIGGQTLIQHYALVIYRNHELATMGLNNLRVIRNGGVRIMDNKLLCYTKSIDWKHVILSNINDVTIDDAAEWAVQETGRICSTGPCEIDNGLVKQCRYLEQGDTPVQSCWGPDRCHRVCQFDRIAEDNNRPGPGCAPNGEKCHEECIGGCSETNDATKCYACKNMHYKGKCIKKCDSHLFVLLDRRCISKKNCLLLNPTDKAKPTQIKAINGVCSDKCPHGYEADPKNPKECRKCIGECEIVCAGNFTIDTYPKAIAIRRCNVIDGSLTLEIRGNADSGMASELNNLFSAIHTIRGYLYVMRSPPFLTLQMFRNLKKIEGQQLYNNKYALAVVENQNLRRLFDENANITIVNGGVQFHNNRMLCFKEIRDLMIRLGKFEEMSETDQSPGSNGDKAICEDTRIDLRLKSVGHDYFELEWPAFNTTDIDHRKFLGYEVFYKIVDKVDPNMSIDDDRSACVDSWNSMFVQHVEKENEPANLTITATLFTDQRILPYTTYAYYIATQMVHHPGAKNGISEIGFVTTEFFHPDPPTVSITEVGTNHIELTWDPPHRPNGEITHYALTWREIDVDVEAVGELLCEKNVPRVFNYNNQITNRDDEIEREKEPPPTTTVAPSITAMFTTPKNTCSSMAGCCACGAAGAEERLNTMADERDESSKFENDLINEVFTSKNSARKRRSLASASEASEMADKKQRTTSRPVKTVILTTGAPNLASGGTDPTTLILNSSDGGEGEVLNATISDASKSPHIEERLVAAERRGKNVTAKPGTNKYSLINLKHSTAYSISISACQNTSALVHYCSAGMKAAKRKHTKAKMDPDMDRVANDTIRVRFLNETTLHVTWDRIPANKTNGGILGYQVYMTEADDRTPQHVCIGAVKGWSPEVNGTLFHRLPDGQYRVGVRAISTAQWGPMSVRSDPVVVFTPGFWTWERLGILGSCILSILVLIGLTAYYYTRKFYGKKVKAMADFMSSNPEYCIDNLYKQDEWEIPQGVVTLGEQCGEGSFGRVWIADAKIAFTSVKGISFGPCAVKQNMDDPTNPENLNYLMEANIMKQFETTFIVKLYGVVSTITPAWVVMELMELGNLRDYLRSKREDEIFNEMECEYYDVIPRAQFHEWAAQIADGMAYLESVKFCHRDLAARNCMINQYEIVKIGDFGMARDLFYHDYYKPSGKRMMPVRWMAPESLKDGKFDSKSDAWSFGIVLYEMMTLGAQPYIGLSNDEVLNYIGMSRKVITKPECCSAYWYKIMKMCWRYTPRERPTFAQLVHLLAQHASPTFRSLSHVINDVNTEVEAIDLEGVDIFDGPAEIDVTPDNERRNTDSIQMREFKPSLDGMNSHSTLSVTDDSARALLPSPPKREGSLDDDYALMTHSGRGFEQNSDNEVRNYSGDGDYVERDVQIDVPTRRNTGASNSSYGTPYCLTNRGNSNERAGFGEGVRLTDAIGSGQLDDTDYVEKDVSMDTRRSTGASTNSYGIPQTNWSSKSGSNYFNKLPQNGRGDRLTQLPGTGHLQNGRGGPNGEYVESQSKNGSPSRNGNGPYYTNRGSFNGRSAFGENERLTEDSEHPLS